MWKKKRARRTVIGSRFGCEYKGQYRRGNFFGGLQAEHRLIFLYHHGYLPKYVDHINRVITDNRIENLRAATHSQNKHNSIKYKNNTSGFKGVNWEECTQKFKAIISLNKKQIHLGRFTTAEEAHKAYCDASENLYGEFSCTL